MRVLGIDPGSHRTGWGIVERHGSRLTHLASGTIKATTGPLAHRLLDIAVALEEILSCHQPDAVAIETVFFARNAQSALALGQARGVTLLCAARAGVSVSEYTAGQIKQATTGRGRAGKEQVQAMVRVVLGLRATLGLDTSDALAVAITHAYLDHSPLTSMLRQSRATPRAAGGGR